MEPAQPDSGNIAIRCPGCGQRFKVGPELSGRMVECGSCDQRFRVGDDVTIRQRRFYPGERRGTSLDQFSRVPTRAAMAPKFQPAVYEKEAPSDVAVNPTSPFRIIMGIAGVVVAIIVALILMFGGEPGGLLDGTSMTKRLILAIFTAIMTLVLLVVANPHARGKGGLVGLVFATILVGLPFFFRDGSQPRVTGDEVKIVSAEAEEAVPEIEDPLRSLKEEMHYEPMAEALEAYGPTREALGKTAIGVWLKDLREFNKHQVVAYLTRSTDASEASWIYPRPPDDFLMVLVDVENDIEKVAELCGRFGKVSRIIGELQVVEVAVRNDAFVQGSVEKLTNPENPSFYELNRRELESIDLGRAGEAVKRLAGVEPKLYRRDMVVRMQELLGLADLEMKTDIARALSVWAEDGDGSSEALARVAKEVMAEKKTVPRPIISFLVQSREDDVVPVLDQLWAADPGTWEGLYGEMGPVIEDRVIARFDEESLALKMSAATLLGKVGTTKSLPALEAARAEARSEYAVVVERAIKSIEARQ